MSKRVFCRQHAFYDCPICRGEEIKWVIPVVDGDTVVGVIEIPDQFDDALSYYDVGWQGKGDPAPPLPLVAVEPHESNLLETVKAIFAIENEPAYREAALRGRKVHEDALTLMDVHPDLDYQEAIEEILRGRDDV